MVIAGCQQLRLRHRPVPLPAWPPPRARAYVLPTHVHLLLLHVTSPPWDLHMLPPSSATTCDLPLLSLPHPRPSHALPWRPLLAPLIHVSSAFCYCRLCWDVHHPLHRFYKNIANVLAMYLYTMLALASGERLYLVLTAHYYLLLLLTTHR